MSDVDKIVSYIKANNILTLCTASGVLPWAASCFYAFDKEAMTFVCLTSLDTRHGAEMSANANVAGTISSQQANVAKIRGLQYSGTAVLLAGDREQHGRDLYYKRFPFARLHAAPIWAILPDVIKYTDNSFGFGTKLSWQRPE
ncbi:pyridoxamine 5'-phosphate oxidase family protein [Telmatospirillum sp.]|uniref:pyridoxamine 5'-phosphate oxidase family protein n=1 Tax=Telmatospirillum sp. TaxID=2079197 RepID=UPI002842AAE4|nr:pyridoxamine 5'-phosphate oxidase family protein [Telmatospirillum sp.]MDR3435390.1 pyridoxamine 5'-phosphate oxidase family protein [Telmatospirillum sp.]